MAVCALGDILTEMISSLSSTTLQCSSAVRDDLNILIQLFSSRIQDKVVEAEKTQPLHPPVRPWLEEINRLVNEMRDLLEDLSAEALRQSTGMSVKIKKLFFGSSSTTTRLKFIQSKMKEMIYNVNKAAENAPDLETLSTLSDEELEKEWTTYNKLSSSQKQCFAYCSLFPEDYKFDVGNLINLWMAEGFLVCTPTSNKCPEDIGIQYVEEFLKRSIFIAEKQEDLDIATTCKMDPRMHGLAKSVSFADSIIVDRKGERAHQGLRRVSFHYSLDLSCGIPSPLFHKAKNLRTFLLPGITQPRMPNSVKMSTFTCETMMSNFKSLRLLDLQNLGIKTVPPSISELKYLTYLDLSKNDMDILSSSITKLYNLQTLKLSHCEALRELPKELSALINLKHLELGGCQKLIGVPAGIGCLTSLLTLSHFLANKSSIYKELTGLNKLRGNLEILHLERVKFDAQDTKVPYLLTKKEHLLGLTLRWDHNDDESRIQLHENDEDSLRRLQPHTNLKVLTVTGNKGEIFPDWFLSLQHLVKFELDNCPTCKSLPPLHRLNSLKVLKLRKLDSLEFILEPNAGTGESAFYPSLQELTLSDCPKLRSWKRVDDGRALFPCISRLEVQYCPELSTMPMYPHLDEKLVLVSSSMKPLLKTIKYGNVNTIALQPPLSNLKSMLIEKIQENCPQELMLLKNFISLKELHIGDCSHLSCLPKGFEHLTSLQSLTIENCKELDLSCFHGWKGLRNLESLTLRDIPKLASLPIGLQYLTSLQRVAIYCCPRLTSLPSKFSSLKRFDISKCHRLPSLPEQMIIDLLLITDCPTLAQWYRTEKAHGSPQTAGIKKVLMRQNSL